MKQPTKLMMPSHMQFPLQAPSPDSSPTLAPSVTQTFYWTKLSQMAPLQPCAPTTRHPNFLLLLLPSLYTYSLFLHLFPPGVECDH